MKTCIKSQRESGTKYVQANENQQTATYWYLQQGQISAQCRLSLFLGQMWVAPPEVLGEHSGAATDPGENGSVVNEVNS